MKVDTLLNVLYHLDRTARADSARLLGRLSASIKGIVFYTDGPAVERMKQIVGSPNFVGVRPYDLVQVLSSKPVFVDNDLVLNLCLEIQRLRRENDEHTRREHEVRRVLEGHIAEAIKILDFRVYNGVDTPLTVAREILAHLQSAETALTTRR